MPDRQGSDELHIRIGRLRDAARAEASSTPAAAREQLGLEDATIRVAAGLAGKNGAERRQVMRDVQVGRTVTPNGRVAKTTLTREEKAARTLSWAKTLTEDQREQFLLSDRFEGLSDSQQEAISEAFAEASDREYSASIGIEDIDYEAPTPDLDLGDEDEDEAVDNSDWEAALEQVEWEEGAS